MNAQLVFLPRLERLLLRLSVKVVPPDERADWLRSWHAELWHWRSPHCGRTRRTIDLCPGLVRDAIWMRANAWQQAYRGTASLCLLMLAAVLLLTLVPQAILCRGTLLAWLGGNTLRFCCEALPISVVSFAVLSRSVRYEDGAGRPFRFQLYFFEFAKLWLVLLIAFSCSEDISLPLFSGHSLIENVAQSQIFVLLGLLALRQSFDDQESRCKHCLRRMSEPERVGRPSRNFLETSGTHLICRDGHGLLSIPELETSWQRSSRWIAT